jgi:hypothetical protein
MSDGTQSLLLVLAGMAIVAFVLFKPQLIGRARSPTAAAARKAIAAAKQRARDAGAGTSARAAALREAALLALNELHQPGLAASFARRAERLDPQNADTFGLLASSLRNASRFRALERMLWRRLGSAHITESDCQRALEELISLYQGPLKRTEIALALQRFRSVAVRNHTTS